MNPRSLALEPVTQTLHCTTRCLPFLAFSRFSLSLPVAGSPTALAVLYTSVCRGLCLNRHMRIHAHVRVSPPERVWPSVLSLCARVLGELHCHCPRFIQRKSGQMARKWNPHTQGRNTRHQGLRLRPHSKPHRGTGAAPCRSLCLSCSAPDRARAVSLSWFRSQHGWCRLPEAFSTLGHPGSRGTGRGWSAFPVCRAPPLTARSEANDISSVLLLPI